MLAQDFSAFLGSRPLWIWGAMILGQGYARAMERRGIQLAGFLDSNPALQGKYALGYPILAPHTSFDTVRRGEAVILVASGHYEAEIVGILADHGLIQDEHFIRSNDLNRVVPAVDVAGVCNLRCISCPRGNMKELPPRGLMPLEDYKAVLDKLIEELPYLPSVQLYVWGEPLLNPELPAMIQYTRERNVLCAISSNLNQGRNLEAVVAAKPDWFKVSCSGFGAETYEVTHTGGNWDTFLSNFQRLARLRDELHPTMQITMAYHLYRHNSGDAYDQMGTLCDQLGVIFRPSPAYLYPMDTIRDYIDGVPLTREAEQTLPLLLMGLEEGLEAARKRSHLPCPECGFPIDWNRAVRFCGVYFSPFLAADFLKVSLAEILVVRDSSEFCRNCIADGLHQFTAVYLAERRLEKRG